MRTRFRPLLILILLVALAGWGLRLAPRSAPQSPESRAWMGADGPPPPEEAPELYPEATMTRPGTTAGPAPAELPFFGFCPEDAPATGPLRRPSLAALLTIGQQEMVDRARAVRRSRDTSDELRAGLRAFFSGDARHALRVLSEAPDRIDDGFDFAATAAQALGARQLHEGNAEEALRLAEHATALAPQEPAGHVLVAIAQQRLGDEPAHREALLRARQLGPDEPSIALATGRALAHTPQLSDALRSLDVYLREHSQDVPIAQLRARLSTQRDIQHGLTESRRGDVRLLWPSGMLDEAVANATLDEIVDSLEAAARTTGMPRRRELLAVVYREHSELLAVTCVPTWTQGVFDGTLRLHVASLRRPRERTRVVRHEVLHAQVRSGGFPAPQWFHEGLAQHFAGEDGKGHRRTFAVMLANRTYVPFPSLEGSFLVISQGSDARFAYHQSLAMIELLVDRRGPRAIHAGIDFLRTGGDAKLLWEHMAGPRGLDGDDLLAYIERRLRTP